MWEYRIRVLRVIDGDTIDAAVDLGFFTHRNIRVRIYGINTPETRTRDLDEKERGFAAKERLEQMLKDADEVILKSHGVGKFGRCLGEIRTIQGNHSHDVAATLIAEGHGVAYFGGKR
jgi:micrococcal nuclease